MSRVVTEAMAQALAEAPFAPNLEWLSLSSWRMPEASKEILSSSPRLSDQIRASFR